MISGNPKLTKKSWFAMLMSSALTSGKHLGPFEPTEKVPVWFFEQEGAAHPLEWRFQALENAYDLKPSDFDLFYFAHMNFVFLDQYQQIRELAAHVKEKEIKLVVFDTFAKVSNADENSVKEVGRALRGVDILREAGTSVLFLHHTKKANTDPRGGGSDDIDADSRGSTALNGFVDVHIGLRRSSDKQRLTNVHMRGKDFDDRKFVCHWDIDEKTVRAKLNMEEIEGDKLPAMATEHYLSMMGDPDESYSLAALKRMWGCSTREDAINIVQSLVEDGAVKFHEKYKKYSTT